MTRIEDIKIPTRLRGADEESIKALADSIRVVGLLNPIVISENLQLICGYNRLEACKRLGFNDIEAVTKNYNEIELALAEIDENLRRQNLSELEICEFIEMRDRHLDALNLRAKVGNNQHGSSKLKTTKAIANSLGISKRTYQVKKQIISNISKEVRDIIRPLPIADNQVALLEISKLSEKKQIQVASGLTSRANKDTVRKKISRVKRENNLKTVRKLADMFKPSDSIKLIAGDFVKVCKRTIKDNSLDAIITDPPYPKEFLPLWAELGKMAYKKLKPGKFLVAYTGKEYLLTVMNSLAKAGLAYYWVCNIEFLGDKPMSHNRKAFEYTRPVLIFYKPPVTPPSECFKDLIKCGEPDKSFHDWQQSLEPVRYFIQHFSKPKDLILDPFVCTGTTAIAAMLEARKCIGIDVEPKNIETAKGRIYEYFKQAA